MPSHDLRVQRTARFHVLGDLDGDWSEVWYALHGYGQLAERFLAEFEPLANPGRLLVAPEGLSRFYLRDGAGRVGASWMTSEERGAEIADQLAWLDALHAHVLERRGVARVRGDVRTGVLGFSQGAATAARWTALGGALAGGLERLVLWGGALPPDLPLETARAAWAGTAIELATGEDDEHAPPERMAADRARLAELGLTCTLHRFTGGHRLDTVLLAQLIG